MLSRPYINFDKINWTDGCVEGGKIKLWHCFKCADNMQTKGLVPEKPVLLFTKAFRMQKGKIYKLC